MSINGYGALETNSFVVTPVLVKVVHKSFGLICPQQRIDLRQAVFTLPVRCESRLGLPTNIEQLFLGYQTCSCAMHIKKIENQRKHSPDKSLGEVTYNADKSLPILCTSRYREGLASKHWVTKGHKCLILSK